MRAKRQTQGVQLEALKDTPDVHFLEVQSRVLYSGEGFCRPGECPAVLAAPVSWHALHRGAWRLTLAHPTEHSSDNWIMLLGKESEKNGPWVFLIKNFPALVWLLPSGNCVCGRGKESSSLPCLCARGEWEQGCTAFHPSPSCISPWLLILAIPKHRQLPCAPSPAQGVLFHETL